MKIGIDLVKSDELAARLGDNLGKVFNDFELAQPKEKLAGIFAAKEAFFKALGRKEDWLSVWVEHESSGKPILKSGLIKGESVEISISYAGEYVTAVVIIF